MISNRILLSIFMATWLVHVLITGSNGAPGDSNDESKLQYDVETTSFPATLAELIADADAKGYPSIIIFFQSTTFFKIYIYHLMKEVIKHYKGLRIICVDTSYENEIETTYNVDSYPYVIIRKDKSEYDRCQGFDFTKIQNFLNDYFKIIYDYDNKMVSDSYPQRLSSSRSSGSTNIYPPDENGNIPPSKQNTKLPGMLKKYYSKSRSNLAKRFRSKSRNVGEGSWTDRINKERHRSSYNRDETDPETIPQKITAGKKNKTKKVSFNLSEPSEP